MRSSSGDSDDDDDRPRRPASQLQDEFRPAQVAAGAGGELVVTSSPVPLELRDEDWICLRGPCRHFMHVVTNLDAQGPLDGTAAATVKQNVYACFPAPGREMEVSGDSIIYECNLWDPRDPASLEERGIAARRRAYHERQAREAERLAAEWRARSPDVRRPGGIAAWLRRAFGR